MPAIHGMEDDRVQIVVDGMDPISACANHMNPALSYIDPSNVGSIKVFAGITPVSVGGDSIGGTISVNSPVPEFAATGQAPLATPLDGTVVLSGRLSVIMRHPGGHDRGAPGRYLALDNPDRIRPGRILWL